MRYLAMIAVSACLLMAGCATTSRTQKPAVPPAEAGPAKASVLRSPVPKGGVPEGEPEVTVKVGEQAAENVVGTPAVAEAEEAPAADAEGEAAPAEKVEAPTPTNEHKTVEDLLGNERISVFDFKDTPMADVLKAFTSLTGQNVVASQTVTEMRISLFLKDVSPRVALSTMCKLYNLWFTTDENVIRIITAEEYGKELVVRRDEKTVVLTLKYASVLGVADTVAKLMGDSVVYEQPEEFASYGHVGTETGRTGTTGSTTGSYRASTTYGGYGAGPASRAAVTDGFEKDLTTKKIEALEKAAPKAGAEGVAEGEIIQGVKAERPLAHIAIFPRNNCIAARSVDGQLLDQITKLVRELDTVTTQVLLEVKILDITLGDDFSSLFDLTYKSGHPAGQPAVDKTDVGVGNFRDANLSSPTVTYAFIDQRISARMQLLETQNRITQVARPLILCANNALGTVFVGEERPITVNWEYEVRDYGGTTGTTSRETFRPVVVLKDIGRRVTVSPSINEDGTVTMKLNTTISALSESGATVPIIDQSNEAHMMTIDTVSTQTVDSIIIAKSENTLALGGLIRERDSRVERRVPILASIPVLGFFFKRMKLQKLKTETVILIQPHIMMSPSVAESVSSDTMNGLSDHPYIKHNRPHIVGWDEKADKLKTGTGAEQQPKK